MHPRILSALLLIHIATVPSPTGAAAPGIDGLSSVEDLVVADFEGTDYGLWKAAGEAFGAGPARGPLPGQMHVDGFKGRTAFLRVVDQATGGWGHINVDHVIQTDRKPPGISTNAVREFVVESRHLNLPIRNGAAKRRVTILVDGQVTVRNDIELADGDPDWWAPLDVSAWQGRKVAIQVDRLPGDSRALSSIEPGATLRDAGTLYRESLRGQFHFSPRRGWNNDPNGLVYFGGEYHLFFQHNPYGWSWGNMHWGHAVSRDLVHWTELTDVLAPDPLGPMFSGSAVVDWNNTSGLGKDGRPPLVLIYTAAGDPTVQCLASSTDGRTFTPEHTRLPGHQGRGFYAPQTFSDLPAGDGRRIQIGWFQTETRGMPFNQSMTIPLELRLASTPEGPRMTFTPVKELASLRTRSSVVPARTLEPGGANPVAGVAVELAEIRAGFEPGDAAEIVINVRGATVRYDTKKQELAVNEQRAHAPLMAGRQRLRIFCDRTGLEVFASDGLTYVPLPFIPEAGNRTVSIEARGGSARLHFLEVGELRSAWNPK